MIPVDFRVYLITDRRLFSAHSSFYMAIEKILRAGVTAIQLREKDLSQKELFDMAVWMRELTHEYHAQLFINDRIDVALSVHADGVHLGQESLPVSIGTKIAGGRLRIGVSAHSIEEALEAERDGADFITVGPVYETFSKLKFGRPIGIDMLREIKALIGIPVYGIGGIQLENVQQVREAGADGIALITGILSAENITKTTKELIRVLQ